MTVECYLSVRLSDDAECAFFRFASGPEVYFRLKIVSNAGRQLDKYRHPLVWLDGKVEIDLSLIHSFNEMRNRLDPTQIPSFSFDKIDVSGVVWHGLINEGSGVIGKILHADHMVVRAYFADYTLEDFSIDLLEFNALKQGIKSNILHI